jgi:hypothetical protein
MELITILFYVVFITVGSILSYIGVTRLKKILIIKNAEETSIEKAADENNVVKLNGRVKKFKDSVKSPIQGKSGCSYAYNVLKRVQTEDGRDWERIEEKKESVDFILEDDTGTAYIYMQIQKMS